MKTKIAASEMPLNQDGSIYHLNLLPEDIGETILLVGDPDRVPRVSQFFDNIELKKEKREFITHTGTKNGKRLSVISTGIGTDNIDIVINEVDALVNIDLKTREIKENHTSLNFIRLGTSGSVNPNIKAGDFVKSRYSVGFDGLMIFYPDFKDSDFKHKFLKDFKYKELESLLYYSECSMELFNQFQDGFVEGNTGSLSGFYGPQGRELRIKSLASDFLDQLHHNGLDNFEMETSAIYAFSSLLGHKALSLNCIIANRSTGEFLDDYIKSVDEMIEKALEVIT